MKKILIYALLALLPCVGHGRRRDVAGEPVRKFDLSPNEKKGLKLKPGEIYNERGTALSGAIVAVDYGWEPEA